MAILGAAQSDFDKIFGGSRVFHDPRLMPRFDVKTSELLVSNNNYQYAADNANFHTYAARHGVSVNCGTAANTYTTLVDISGGAGIMTAATGPYNNAEADVTFRFTVDGTVYTVLTAAAGNTYRGVLGGSLRGYGTFEYFNLQARPDTGGDAGEGIVRQEGTESNFTIPIPTLALAGHAGSYPILGWTDSFKVEVQTSSGNYGTGYKNACVFYIVL